MIRAHAVFSTRVVATQNFPRRTKMQYFRTENPENTDNTPLRLARRRAAFELQCFRNCTLSSTKNLYYNRTSLKHRAPANSLLEQISLKLAIIDAFTLEADLPTSHFRQPHVYYSLRIFSKIVPPAAEL